MTATPILSLTTIYAHNNTPQKQTKTEERRPRYVYIYKDYVSLIISTIELTTTLQNSMEGGDDQYPIGGFTTIHMANQVKILTGSKPNDILVLLSEGK